MPVYNYNYTVENLKFLDKLHEYLLQFDLPEFHLINESQLNIVFNDSLSENQIDILNEAIQDYTPPQSYDIIIKSENINIITNKISSVDYSTVASDIWISDIDKDNVSDLGYISIISYINNPNNISSVTYNVKVIDLLNNTILKQVV